MRKVRKSISVDPDLWEKAQKVCLQDIGSNSMSSYVDFLINERLKKQKFQLDIEQESKRKK